ncbi:MAG: HD domain-containing phosphohydrolase [Nitrospiraceae bacterium]
MPASSRINDTSITVGEPERRAYESHPRASAITLERQGQFPPAVEQILAEHHAYLDGSGFPSKQQALAGIDAHRDDHRPL